MIALLALLAAQAAQDGAAPDIRAYAPGTPPYGTGGDPQSLGFAILPQDDDLTERRGDTLWRRLNHIPLGEDAYLTLQAIAHVEPQLIDDAVYGAFPDDDLSLDARLNVYAGLSWGGRYRVYGALKHANRWDDEVATLPIERDDIDLHMLFGEVAFGDAFGGEVGDTLLRVGRQELHYGAGRLISIRGGPGVRDDFDAAILRHRRGAWTAEAFGAFVVTDEVGAFDNDTVWDEGVWGLYATRAFESRDTLDLYYVGQRALGMPNVAGPSDDTRHYIGARHFRPPPPDGVGWDAEVTYLFGEAEPAGPDAGLRPDADIAAWSATAEVNVSRDAWAWSPNLRLRAGYTTGDGDPDDDTVRTFRAPYPPGRFFGEFTPIGPGNLLGATAAVEFEPTPKLSVSPYVTAFWRAETEDGSYNPPGLLVRGADGDERFVGWQANLLSTYVIDENWSVFSEAGVFFTGPYIRDNPPAEDIGFAKVALQFRF